MWIKMWQPTIIWIKWKTPMFWHEQSPVWSWVRISCKSACISVEFGLTRRSYRRMNFQGVLRVLSAVGLLVLLEAVTYSLAAISAENNSGMYNINLVFFLRDSWRNKIRVIKTCFHKQCLSTCTAQIKASNSLEWKSEFHNLYSLIHYLELVFYCSLERYSGGSWQRQFFSHSNMSHIKMSRSYHSWRTELLITRVFSRYMWHLWSPPRPTLQFRDTHEPPPPF